MKTNRSRLSTGRKPIVMLVGAVVACLLLVAVSATSFASMTPPPVRRHIDRSQVTAFPTLMIITVPAVQPVQTPQTTPPGSQRQNRQDARPQGDAASLIEQADALALQSQFSDADSLYAEAVRQDVRNPLAYGHWARALLWDLRTEDALAKALLGTQIDPENAEGFIYLARARDWLGESEAALAAAQHAVTLAPASADAHAILAEIYTDANRPDRAQESIDAALQLEPDNAETHRSYAYLLAAQDNLDEAIKQAERAAQVQTGLWLRYDDLATMLRLIGDYEQSIRFYQWAIDLWPKAVSHTGMGLCQIELGQWDDASASFTHAIELDPNSAAAHGGLALVMARQGQCDSAMLEVETALALDPSNTAALEASDTCTGTAPSGLVPTRRASTPQVFRVPATSEPVAESTPFTVPPLEQPAGPPSLPPAPPAQAMLTGRLVYSVFDPARATFDLYLASLDGSGRGRILAEAGSADLSPDGRQIAFRSWDSGNRGLYAQSLGGDDRRILTTQYYGEDTLPDWSPAGDLIVFSSRRESDRRSRIYVANPAGKDDTVVRIGAEAAYGEHPCWLPDGRIVFNGCLGNNCGLLVMNRDGGNPVQLTSHPSDTAPSGSPDGAWVAFMSSRDGNWELYLVSTAGGAPVRLTNDVANDGLPEWSPDGRSIAFASSRGGRWGIWVMGMDGSNPQMLIEPEGPLDGHVRQEPEFASRGWVDENISWVR